MKSFGYSMAKTNELSRLLYNHPVSTALTPNASRTKIGDVHNKASGKVRYAAGENFLSRILDKTPSS